MEVITYLILLSVLGLVYKNWRDFYNDSVDASIY